MAMRRTAEVVLTLALGFCAGCSNRTAVPEDVSTSESASSAGLTPSQSAAVEPAPTVKLAPVPEPPNVPKSDRWFLMTPANGGDRIKTYIHIVTAWSGNADAPVRITYTLVNIISGKRSGVMLENLCLNDEWLSPVKVVFSSLRNPATPISTATFTRPDKGSTAGRRINIVEGPKGSSPEEWTVKEHSVLAFTPLEMVRWLPFDKDRVVKLTLLSPTCAGVARDCAISYEGEEEIEFQGRKMRLHKFLLKMADDTGTSEFWLDGDRALVRAQINFAPVTPITAEEGRKATEEEKTPVPAR